MNMDKLNINVMWDTWNPKSVVAEAVYGAGVATEKNTFCIFNAIKMDNACLHITKFYVPHKYRRRGIASRVFHKVLGFCRDISIKQLVVEPCPDIVDKPLTKEELVLFYKSLGFIYLDKYMSMDRYVYYLEA